jgi:predicted DNA repair protein MutK
LALIDDIASVLDDVALMSKVAAKKTAGVLGDDLALNAQQVTGVNADRELPVVWAVAKGSLMQQGDPGAGRAGHLGLRRPGDHAAADDRRRLPVLRRLRKAGPQIPAQRGRGCGPRGRTGDGAGRPMVDMRAVEKDKIKGAVRTDFILSAEIIVIALGVVNATPPSAQQVAVLVAVAIAMTVGVYGLVAGIVKIDDAGLYLSRRQGGFAQGLGRLLLAAAPRLMKFLSVVGTAAMFMVGGGIIGHAFGPLHHLAENAARGRHAGRRRPAGGGDADRDRCRGRRRHRRRRAGRGDPRTTPARTQGLIPK